MHITTRLIAIGLAAAGFLPVPVTHAQNQSPSPPLATAPNSKVQPADISDQKLDAVAAAVKKVSLVSEAYQKKLIEAPYSEKERIMDEAYEAVTKAVTDQGVSIEEYTTIMHVVENDPTLRSKLAERLK